jgi:hypothetical protein
MASLAKWKYRRVELKLSKNYKNAKQIILTRSLKKVMFPYESSKNWIDKNSSKIMFLYEISKEICWCKKALKSFLYSLMNTSNTNIKFHVTQRRLFLFTECQPFTFVLWLSSLTLFFNIFMLSTVIIFVCTFLYYFYLINIIFHRPTNVRTVHESHKQCQDTKRTN